MSELSDQLRDRLERLIQSAQQDFKSVQSIPEAADVFRPLFDALQSTLQNVDASASEKIDSQ